MPPKQNQKQHEEFTPGIALTLLTNAVEYGASDIHFEPQENQSVLVRYRVDGRLFSVRTLSAAEAPSVFVLLKVAAKLDIAGRGVQEAGFEMNLCKRRVSIRLSAVPTVNGQKLVLRLFDPKVYLAKLETLGLDEHNLALYRQAVGKAFGLIVLTGSTGSGKTTTIYATAYELLSRACSIHCLQDPAEIRLNGITQMEVNTDQGLSFSELIKYSLRQDPDVLIIGEIRDEATAAAAVRAAVTGHLVITTLHARSPYSAILRLRELGITQGMLEEVLTCVVSQKLVRKLCTQCRQELENGTFLGKPITAWHAPGCQACKNEGLSGRTGVFEVLPITQELIQAVFKSASQERIHEIGKHAGWRPFAHRLSYYIENGIISISEAQHLINSWS